MTFARCLIVALNLVLNVKTNAPKLFYQEPDYILLFFHPFIVDPMTSTKYIIEPSVYLHLVDKGDRGPLRTEHCLVAYGHLMKH